MSKTPMAKVEVLIVEVGVADSTLLRKTCHFPYQRQIRDLNVQRLGLEMEKGRFVQGTPVFFCVLPDGTQYIVNGNHTLEAVAYSGRPQKLVFIFLHVADLAEAAAVYASFDLHKARTWIDALKATGRDTEMPMAARVAAAVKMIMSGFKYSPENVEANSSRASRFDFMDDYKDAATLLHGAMAGAPMINSRVIVRASVMAVALETLRYQPRDGVEFWSAVAKDDGLAANDARKALLRWLSSHKAQQGQAAYAMTRACAHAWNTWCKGQPLTLLRPAMTGNFVLAGTPWTGRRPDATDLPVPTDALNAAETGPRVAELFDTGMTVTDQGAVPVVRHRPPQGAAK